jgi:hypothetical protein
MFTNQIVTKITDFLVSIGIDVRAHVLTGKTFLPGIMVRNGELLVDETLLKYPGDLLHEGGHLALMTAAQRAIATDEVDHEDTEVFEVAVIAWSYAAALHLEIDPGKVLHGGGYQGQSAALLQTFELGVYPGASKLAELGLTQVGIEIDGPKYPNMIRWLRE